jgi:hypothetical protein
MVKVNVEPDCGNAPKKILLRDFMIAFANNDVPSLLDWVADDIQWELVGEHSVTGKSDIEHAIRTLLHTTVKEMTIANIITHGDAGSVNGTMTFDDGKSYGFCNVCTFSSYSKNAKIKAIASYFIEINM